MKKFVYLFKEADGEDKVLFGAKGANLAQMTKIGLPVPQGFLITTEACTKYFEDGKLLKNDISAQIEKKLEQLEKLTGKNLGKAENPLLVAVRSGARVSMPGMMDTILDVGINDEVVKGLAKLTKNEWFAYDSYRRFIFMFATLVMQHDVQRYEEILDQVKAKQGVALDKDLSIEALKKIVLMYKRLYREIQNAELPQDPKVQLVEAVKAVFKSWDNPRAEVYRKMHDIPYSWGTGVSVQTMVFGNMGDDCSTGVVFTRNPATGKKEIYGEFLINAQGEDITSGTRTLLPISQLQRKSPEIYTQFVTILQKLEKHYKDMQEVEFTIEKNKLYILQTRNGRRTAKAGLKIAMDFVKEKVLDEKNALLMIDPRQMDTLMHQAFVDSAIKKAKPIGEGIPVSPGAASGKICFSADKAIRTSAKKEKVVLVVPELSSEDVRQLNFVEGFLTTRGGMTSHASVVARGNGICCVAGCSDIVFADDKKSFTLGGNKYKEGDDISFDGSTGKIYEGEIPTEEAKLSNDFVTIMKWSDKYREMGVRANADNANDTELAAKLGAEGIGLCRTEHMFLDKTSLKLIRELIISDSVKERMSALNKLLPKQKEDFKAIFKAMKGKPVTIRFLDPPFNEFLPQSDEELTSLAKSLNMTFDELKAKVNSLHEVNPMMGHRGLRIAISYPEIVEMQTEAIIRAAIEVQKENRTELCPELMIPLTSDCAEFKFVKDIVVAKADKILQETNASLKYKVGTMIEVPRAAITADQIAKFAEFFSFGTNDLTQLTYGFSRDDSWKFLDDYYSKKIFDSNPFVKLDQNGVGKILRIASELGKSTRPDIELGVCGEHGGEPVAIEYFHRIGLNYVSCSPYRVPVARLAAAQSAIRYSRSKKSFFRRKK